MAMDIFDAVNPAQLTGYVRAALADFAINKFRFSRYLPDKPIDDIEYRFFAGNTGLIDAAVVSTYDAETPIGNRPGLMRVTGELPPIKRKVRLGEYDRLRLRNAGSAEIATFVFADAKRQAQSVAARLELFRGEALTTGKLTISENGVTATVDYLRASTHTITAGTLWSNTAASTPISDLITWSQLILADTGELPDVLALSTQSLNFLLQNAQVKSMASSIVTSPALVSQAALRSVIETYVPNITTIEVYDAQVKVGGSATRILPINKIALFKNEPELGDTFTGVTAEQLELAEVTGTIEPGIVAVATKEYDPPSVWTKAAAIALPVLANPNLTIGATVS